VQCSAEAAALTPASISLEARSVSNQVCTPQGQRPARTAVHRTLPAAAPEHVARPYSPILVPQSR